MNKSMYFGLFFQCHVKLIGRFPVFVSMSESARHRFHGCRSHLLKAGVSPVQCLFVIVKV